MIVFHGKSVESGNESPKIEQFNGAYFFTEKEDFAIFEAEAKAEIKKENPVLLVYELNLQNPLKLKQDDTKKYVQCLKDGRLDLFLDDIKFKGYDSIIIKENIDIGTEYIVFNPLLFKLIVIKKLI